MTVPIAGCSGQARPLLAVGSMGQAPRSTSSAPASQASLEGGTGLRYLPHEERLRDGAWLSLELTGFWWDLTAARSERVMEEREPGCSQPAGNMSGNGHEVKHEFQIEYKDIIFPHEDTQTVGWAAQRGCSVSVPGGFQDSTG